MPPERLNLPPELVISIQRILHVRQDDPLDVLGYFDPVDTLNLLFPDGLPHCTFVI